MINMMTTSDIPTVDPDFDDLELLYSDPEADCVGEFGDEVPLANDREQALHDFWTAWDERFQDKLDRRSK